MKKISLVILCTGFVLLLWGCQTKLTGELEAKTKAPPFELQDYTGKTITLADFQGRPLVINSWAAWCPLCVEELVDFAKVQREFRNQVTVIAINRAEPLRVAKEFTDELGVTDDLVFLLDPEDSYYQSLGGFSMPETIFVDTEGNIREHKRGPLTESEFRQKVEKLLGSLEPAA